LSEERIIKAIRFGILSPEEIRQMAVTTVITAEAYDEDGLPIEGGVMDPRLGVIEPGQRCPTCGNTLAQCPGHFGKIELARPVIHVGFVKHIYDLLRATCRHCGRILISQKDVERYLSLLQRLEKKWPILARQLVEHVKKKAIKTMECPHCVRKAHNVL